VANANPIKFGTDGVRGRVDSEVTAEVAYAIGQAAVEVLGDDGFVVGWDTRESGETLVQAFSAGVGHLGAAVRQIGVAPTPAVAFVASATRCAGCSVTASHNSSDYNGLKFFDSSGLKLTDAQEAAIADRANRHLGSQTLPALDQRTLTVDPDLIDAYLRHLLEQVAGIDLSGLAIGIDCAHGAATAVAPMLFGELQTRRLVIVGDQPDGQNINHGVGSTNIDHLSDEVIREGLDLGFSFDGDADRVMAITATGDVLDGDFLLAILADDMLERGVLTDGKVVATHWSNLGLFKALRARGIDVIETEVGDKFVLEVLTRDGLSLGGEQSGHIILRDQSTTGDGLLTAIALLGVLARRGRTLADLASTAMQKMPQVSVAVDVDDPRAVVEAIRAEADDEGRLLGDDGRVIIRPSGTEAVVRVMAEATTPERAQQAVDRMRAAIARLALRTAEG
jgi:phosphoglucosamine mutase